MWFSDKLSEILNYYLLNNSIAQIWTAVLAYILIFFILKQVLQLGIKRIHSYTKWKKINFGILLLDIIKNTPQYFFITLQIYIPLKILNLPELADNIIDGIFLIILIFQTVRIWNKILLYLIKHFFGQKGKMQKTTQNALQLMVKIIVRTLWWLLLLSNLWIEITPLIASLWVWGIAVAFALQNMLQDIFSSFSIFISTPFKVWDYISINDKISWTVDNISFKATHIRTIQGHEIRIPNKDIISNPLENFGGMKERRIRFNLGVIYETSQSKLKKIPKIIQKIIEKDEEITYERTKLTNLWDFSINFKISYVIQDPDYMKYLDKNHIILMGILENFEKEWIELAYPTQVIYNKK